MTTQTHSAAAKGKNGEHSLEVPDNGFRGFAAFDVGPQGRTIDLSFTRGAKGVLVLAVNADQAAKSELLCSWADGVSFAASAGVYYVFWLAKAEKPTAKAFVDYLASHGEAGPPGTVILRPPPVI